MIIRSLEVSGVGRFASPTRLAGFSPGLNILSAPNEAGKSTLFRALRTCLFQRHSSKTNDIAQLASNDANLPVEIVVSFSTGGHDYVIRKQFIRSAMAHLTRDGADFARGAQADELVWELLGMTPGGGRGGPDTGSFGLLWVAQAKSFAFERPSEAAENELNALIAAEVGALVGGERARNVLQRVSASLLERETETGRPKAGGPLRAAIDAHAELVEREEALGRQLAELEHDFAELARIRSELARRRDPRLKGEMTERLAKAREAREAGNTAAAVLARMEIERDAARDRFASAKERLSAALSTQKRLAEAREQLAVLYAQIEEETKRHAGSDALVDKATTELARADASLEARRIEVGRAEAMLQAIEAGERISEWETRRAEVTRLVQRRGEIDVALAGIAATPERLQEARTLRETIVTLEARLEAQAARLAVALQGDADRSVTIDGAPVADGHAQTLRRRTEIAISGVGTITIAPAEAGISQERDLAEARSAFNRALHDMGVTSLAAAAEALEAARDLRAERKSLAERIGTAGRDLGSGDPLGVLTERIAQTQALMAQAIARAGAGELPDRAALHESRDSLRDREREAIGHRERRISALQEAREMRAGIASRLSALRAQAEELAARVAAAELEAAETASPDAVAHRRAENDAAETSLARAQAAYENQTVNTPDAEERAARELRVERLQQALDNHQSELARLERDAELLEAGIRRIGADGLEERLAALTAEREIAERDKARAERETQALRLLRDTISDTLSEGRTRFLAPVKENLRPFIGALFPGAELDIGDDFTPARLIRGSGDEGFSTLSDGTREQIAVLVRLALGALLAARGRPAPIILDDALVFSDDDRIEGMFDALARAAENQQVIILTCRSRAFAPIGGTLLRIEPGEREAGLRMAGE